MKSLLTCLIAIVCCINPGISRDTTFHISQIYPIDRGHSYIGFEVKYMGYAKVKGRFAEFSGAVRYDEHDISKTSVTVKIDVASIDTDNDWRDDDLRSDNWFDAETFPYITFVSHTVKASDHGFKLIGDLTMKDVTKTVTLEMEPASGVLKDIRGDNQVIFNGSVALKRKDYGVEGKNWSKVKEGMTAVGSEVTIELTILGKQVLADNFRNRMQNPDRPHVQIYQVASQEGAQSALQIFEELRADTTARISAGTLFLAGSMLLKEGNISQALPLLEANVHAFPDDARVYRAYGEALAWDGQLEKAGAHYQLALARDADNALDREVLRHLIVD